MRKIILITFLFGLLAGCSIFEPYKPDLQQGNVITEKMVNSLHVGMTPVQVVNAMGGQPVLQNAFQDETLNYVYTYEPSKGKLTEKKVVLTFKNNKLATIEK